MYTETTVKRKFTVDSKRDWSETFLFGLKLVLTVMFISSFYLFL